MIDYKHTPGPWVADKDDSGIYEIREASELDRPLDNRDWLAIIYMGNPNDTYESEEERLEEATANAQLIASAPDLLAERDALRERVEKLKADRDALLEATEKFLKQYQMPCKHCNSDRTWCNGCADNVTHKNLQNAVAAARGEE